MTAQILYPTDALQLAKAALTASQDAVAERLSAILHGAGVDPYVVECALDDIYALVTRAHAVGTEVGEQNARLLRDLRGQR